MKPELLQTISQVLIFAGIILTAVGGYGHFHYGKKTTQNREIVLDKKIENIPESINSTSNKNTSKVLDALSGVKQSVDSLSASEGFNISNITYPSSGVYGINILEKNKNNYAVGTYSMNALIPRNQKLLVIVSGSKWAFPVFQSIPGWRHFEFENKNNNISRKFETVKFGTVDLEFLLTAPDRIDIKVFENGSKTPTWQKTILVE